MSKRTIDDFIRERKELIENMSRYCGQDAKRFFHLDSQVYKDGALSAKMKELLGLVASLVLRCDDCINYHLVNCHENGISDEELAEALTVGLIAGGSITIPHLRRAYAGWDELKKGGKV
ncbi:MAG: carboxymuconolactone decarboxylase family protein [candidate division WOR-3 bacterium]|nr:MAG: carboxymuconolactone decarboxylase family protein [candidate division WOR-3 bacterium]